MTLVATSDGLVQLARQANHEHRLAAASAAEFIEHVVRCGEALLAARAQVERRHWHRWLDQNFEATTTTANLYCRIAAYRDQLPPDVTSATDAKVLLRGLPAVAGDPHAYGDELRNEALRLRRQGRSLNEIAQTLDVGKATVHWWVNPERRKAQARRSRAARKALQRLEGETEVRRAAKRAGGAIAETYAAAERMQDLIGQAHVQATDPEARRALSEAGVHYRRMRDLIVRALGAS
jgi:transposase